MLLIAIKKNTFLSKPRHNVNQILKKTIETIKFWKIYFDALVN